MTPTSARPSAAATVAGGLVVGVGAAALALLAVLALALAAVAAAPSADGSVDVDWAGATDVAVSMWLLGFGVPAVAGEIIITWAPLGMTLLAYALTAALARRHLAPVPASWLAAAFSMALVVGIVATAADSPEAWKGAAFGFVVASAGCARGLARAHGAQALPRWRPVAVVASGLRLGAAVSLAVVALGAATTLVWLLSSAGAVGEQAESLGPDAVGGVALAVGQSAYVPNVAVWAVAWLAGVPLELGQHVPGLPLLAALPAGAAGWWGFALIAAVAALARWRARRWMPPGPAGWAVTGLGLACVAVVVAVLTAISGGSWGGGERVGPQIAPSVWALLLPTAVGMLAVGVSRSRASGSPNPAPRTAAGPRPPRRPPGTRPQR